MYRSTFGGIIGGVAATAQFWFIPPSVVKAQIWRWLSIDVSLDEAAFCGTILVGLAGVLATHWKADRKDAPAILPMAK